MRILYLDIDSLRPDHLGCYGYHRSTSPNIDRVAEQAVRFDNLYVSDGPCLPSRTALWSGRCRFHTGVVNHGGGAAIPFSEGVSRGHRDVFGKTSWMVALRQVGFVTTTISSFAERHSAWHWLAGYYEVISPLRRGLERADDVSSHAIDWIRRNARRDNWFLHINFWDPHTPYRTPIKYGNPFEDKPLPAWLTEETRLRCWNGFGPHSAQEPHEWGDESFIYDNPRLPVQLDTMENVKRWIDGYDIGIRYADDHIGHILNALTDEGVFDETVIMISADHAENQGELNIWGEHHTADQITARVPLIVRWPGMTNTPRADSALHYHFDWAATLVELVGGIVPDNWDAVPFAADFREKRQQGRDYLVLSNQTWTCQRSVRFDQYICLRTYHDGFKQLEPVMLFNVEDDHHQQHDLAPNSPEVVNRAMALLAEWHHRMTLTSTTNIDPMMTVLREGGPFYTRGQLPKYLKRPRETGRAHHAERLAILHPNEV